jgi:hypothetical protein
VIRVQTGWFFFEDEIIKYSRDMCQAIGDDPSEGIL